MKTPRFWKKRNLLASLLYPLGTLYSFGTAWRLKHGEKHKLNRPVICIGNLTAGGTGKTPVSLSIAKLLQAKGKNPFFLSRGYGGTLKDILVDNRVHTAEQAGDEPLLLSLTAPTVVNPDRYLGALKAVKSGAELIIMDDGFQNPGLEKDLSFIVIEGSFGFGNLWCIPAGPLRENIEEGLKRATAAIIIGEDTYGAAKLLGDLPVFYANIKAVDPKIKNKDIYAFAGIGRPQKFYESLKGLGFNIIKKFSFPDHYNYKPKDLEKILTKAHKNGHPVFTTSKDFVKIPADLRDNFHVLEIEVKWQNEKSLIDFILKNI